jgi:AcrR family transcriptional regulator
MTIDARRTDTRERIIDVAAKMFSTRGYAATSIRDIAEELGVTKAALYYHFTSKDEILHALVDIPIESIRRALEQPRDTSTPQGRRAFVYSVLEAMAECDPEAIAVFKDPQLQAFIGVEIAGSGITNVLAIELAKGLSGTDDPAKIEHEHLLRATAAVGTGQTLIDTWHLVYGEVQKFTPENLEYITDTVCRTLEA